MKRKKHVAVLGATGSIGTQALEVIAAHSDLLTAEIISGHNNSELLIEQALKFSPKAVVVTGSQDAYEAVSGALRGKSIEVLHGQEALNEVVQRDSVDLVLGAIVGFAGLYSILAAIDAGKPIALANKETLVVAGPLVMAKAREKGVRIIPVDSEHSAIFQCLVGEELTAINKIILTASGGPFLGKKPNFLVNVKASHALQHPNWTMGAKITIDSATLMNKGLEMIEAKWLFGLKDEQIEVVIHPQSILHSFVEFVDGSLKAQMGLPDMKLPIQYALVYPDRVSNDFKRFNFRDYTKLHFDQPDTKTFRNLALAKEAMEKEGNLPCVLNAANEVVVEAFLHNKVNFLEMSDMIEKVMEQVAFVADPQLDDYIQSDKEARYIAAELVKKSQLSAY